MDRLLSTRYTGLIFFLMFMCRVGALGQMNGIRTDGAVKPVLGPKASAMGNAMKDAGIRFTENRGQVADTRGTARPDILYTASSSGMRLFLRRDGISYVFTRWVPDSSSRPANDPILSHHRIEPPSGHLDLYRMDMQLIGANPKAEVISEERTDDLTNYYLSQCPDGITHVRSYRRLTYREIYPHIDLVFHSDGSGMKYDFMVHPGGRVADIAWRYVGSDGAAISAGGTVRALTALGNLEEAAPYAYQGEQHGVDCRYIDNGGRFSYAVAVYNHSETLVIDPTLQWATYCGGNSAELSGFGTEGVAADATGNVAIVGETASPDLPVTPGVTQTTRIGSGYDIYMLELGPAGNLIWCTYWGGSGFNEATGIAFDGLGNCAVAGLTSDPNFPVGPNALQPVDAGGYEIIVGDFDATGVRRWSTFFGGVRNDGWGAVSTDQTVSVAADQQGNVVVAAETYGTDFPTRAAWQAAAGGGSDATVSKFSPTGTLLWSSYYGGINDDASTGVAIGTGGEIVVCGVTSSANLPMFGASYQPNLHGGPATFILKLSANGVPQWSTYYGVVTVSSVTSTAIAIDASGAIAIVGDAGAGLPTTPASFQSTANGPSSGYVAKFDINGQHLWSTYYGGTSIDGVLGVAFGSSGDILVGGCTNSPNFPVTAGAYQVQLNGSDYDAFLVQLDATGAQKWATFYGGTGQDQGSGVAYGGGGMYIVGYTYSTDLPGTANGFQPNYRGGFSDHFIVKFASCALGIPSINASGPLVLCEGDSVTITAPAGYTTYKWSPNNESGTKITAKRTGIYSVTTTDATGCVNASQTIAVRVNKKPVPVITPAGPLTICQGDSVKLSARQIGFISYKWSNNDTLDAIWVKTAGTYTVQVVDTNGCIGQSASVLIRVNPAPFRPVLSSIDTIWICPDSVLRLDVGGGYASYAWSPSGEDVRTIQARAPGVYYVDVTNASNCHARSDTVVVLAYPSVPAVLLVTGSAEFCSGDSVVLQTPPGFMSPRWSNGSTESRLAVRASGLYYATAIDSNGCRERTDSIRVTVHPSPKADITGPASVCMNASTTYGTAAGTTLRYAWSITGAGSIQGASDGSSVSVQWGASGNGTVTLQVADASTGCSTTSKRNVVIGTSLKPVITPSGAITLCAGDSVELDAGAGYTKYTWSTGVTTRTIWVKDSAAYAVSVVDASGCGGTSDTVRARIEARPAPVIAGPLKVCLASNGSYSVAALAGASYSWSVSGGTITSGDGTSSIAVQWGSGPAGTVDVTVTSAGGCVGTASQVKVDIGSSLKPVITPSGTITLCTGDSIELDAGAGYASYAWSTGETSERIVVRTAGSYAVTVSDISGCGGTSDSVRVVLHAPPVVTIAPAGPITLKAGDSIVLDAGSGYTSYRWRRGSTQLGSSQRLTALDSGDYTVTITDANGCSGSAVVRIDREASFSGIATIALGNTSASPGETVEIPLLLISSTNLAAAGASSYEARVRYHASLLIPSGATPRGRLDGEDRVLTVTGNLPPGMTSGDLTQLEFIVALGDDSVSAMKLESVTWRGTAGGEVSVASTLENGEFHLTGLCMNGGARLIRAGGEEGLKAVIPNPTNSVVRIEYDLVEDGPCRLAIVDLLGREVGVVYAGDRVHGTYAESYDVHSLASGLYRIVLETATGRMSAVMEVAR